MLTDAKIWSLQKQVDVFVDGIWSSCFVSVWSCGNLVFSPSVMLGCKFQLLPRMEEL
jgi:hypothetical protein